MDNDRRRYHLPSVGRRHPQLGGDGTRNRIKRLEIDVEDDWQVGVYDLRARGDRKNGGGKNKREMLSKRHGVPPERFVMKTILCRRLDYAMKRSVRLVYP